MKKIIVILMVMLLSSCSGATLGKAALGTLAGGPNVAANVQAGKTNSQTLGMNENNSYTFKDIENSTIRPVSRPTGVTTTAPVENIEQTNYNVNPFWIVFLVVWSIFLWQLPSPDALSEKLRKFFKKKNKNN